MRKRFFLNCLLLLVLIAVMSTSAFAISESDVESAVSASGKETVSGNVLVWFLCAIAFLKVSQKIDSFLSSLGLNVGHTGGSMLSEAMIAMRAINTATSAVGSALGSRSRHGSAPTSGKSAAGSAASAGFFSGGLVGMASRKIASDAVRTATAEKNIVQPQQAEATVSRTHANSDTHSGSQSASEQQRQNTSQLDQNQQTVSSRAVKSEQQERSQQALHESQRSVDASKLHQDTQSAQEQQFHAALHTEDQQASHLAFQSEQGEFVGSVVQSDEFDASSEEARTEQSQVMQSALQQEQIGVTQREQAQHTQQDTQTATFRQVESQSRQHTAQSDKQFFFVRNGLSKTTIAERTVQAQESPGRFLHSRTPSAAPASAPANEAPAARPAPIPSAPTQFRSFGGTLFAKSLYQGGAFANDVIGTVAKGDCRTTGSITGETATRSLMSYMGFTALGEHATNIPRYQDVEIGGGRITGREFTPEHPGGIDFCMYHADQYAQPKGDYSKVYSADDAAWYKQYAADTVERKPYQTEDGKIAYHEKIVQKLPNPPQRKDRM
ncbi:MAG: hypothetical protein ACLTLM_11510 [Oscillospiraceae bacterium]